MISNGSDLAMTSPSSPSAPEVHVIQTPTDAIVVIKGRKYKQRPLGPAPFASFEDLSDELDSPPEAARVSLPGIKEDPSSQLQSPSTPLPQVTTVTLTEKEEQGLKEALKSSLEASAPPRIDISRASSSSQHEDSITSSPDRENDTHNLGYKEDGTVDLRSSTEELDYIQEPGTVEASEEKRRRERMLKRQQQVRNSGDTQSQYEYVERKDSSCSVMSDVGLLCISGRTSRLSSIGSAASGGSAASCTSHLSTGSHLSRKSSRSPSPHKMLLETSFCGSKPMHSRSVEPEASPGFVILSEKSVSRPPSSLRSRSPSPHKMLLETSFCGIKQMSSSEKHVSDEKSEKVSEKQKPQSSSSKALASDAGIIKEKSPLDVVQKSQTKSLEVEGKAEKPKLDKQDEIRILGQAVDAFASAGKLKKASLPFKMEKKPSKPKKVISLRELPVDELYIPLKGPEVDFEEIIRKASPNVKKKGDALTVQPSAADEIYIPLVSPVESSADKRLVSSTCQKPKASTSKASSKTVPSKANFDAKQAPAKQKPRMKEYEVCEDGSIFIPLHSPDEDKRTRDFDVEAEEKDTEYRGSYRVVPDKETKLESKPLEMLNLSDTTSTSKKTLTQMLSAGKTEVTSGSRTPSPGSSLSRKSSFANLFRKSDVCGSPDSQSGSSTRKKSGTLSVASRETTEGSRDKGHSRSKSKERSSASSSSQSSSSKKNVFTNLFGKKKSESKSVAGGKDTSQKEAPQKLDLRFTFDSGAEIRHKTSEKEDYIIIPLRDPSDPSDSLDMENASEQPEPATEQREKPSESENLEKVELHETAVEIELQKEEFTPSLSAEASSKEINEKSVSEEEEIIKQSPEMCSKNIIHVEQSRLPSAAQLDEEESAEDSSSKKENGETVYLVDKDSMAISLDKESILDADEKASREEMLAVSADGFRKLKLPPEPGDLNDDHERKGLVLQESFDDELPYIPTTLPQERSLGIPLVPVKQRMADIKMCPIDRPRSTTPINPTTLEDYVSSKEPTSVSEEEKMKISLPRDDSVTSKGKSPRRFSAKGKSWLEFAEEGLQIPKDHRKGSIKTPPSPPPPHPPLPSRSSSPTSALSTSAPQTTSSWIDFEALPEKKKITKRITTVPALKSSEKGAGTSDKTSGGSGFGRVYNYVSPEDCQCECHDHNAFYHDETDSMKGRRDRSSCRRTQKNGDYHPKKSGLTKVTSQEQCKKNECVYCNGGRERRDELVSEGESDTEEKPLLDVDSEGEENEGDSGSRKVKKNVGLRRKISRDFEKVTDQSTREQVGLEPLSNSSSEGSSRENAKDPEKSAQEGISSKPFEMDLHADSSRSSLLSQEDLISPDDEGKNFFPMGQ